MSRHAIHLVGSVNGTDFTGTLAQNAALAGRLKLPESLGAGRHGRSILRTIAVTSFDNNDWEFWFFANIGQQQPLGGTQAETFLGRWSFVAADAVRIAGAGLYYYYIDGLSIPYYDADAHNYRPDGTGGSPPADGTYLNVALINRSAGAKTAGLYFAATFGLEPTYGD